MSSLLHGGTLPFFTPTIFITRIPIILVRFHLSARQYYTINPSMVCYYLTPDYNLRH